MAIWQALVLHCVFLPRDSTARCLVVNLTVLRSSVCGNGGHKILTSILLQFQSFSK
ncbi:hypothetical protein AAZV13_08G271000 [Glycine max]